MQSNDGGDCREQGYGVERVVPTLSAVRCFRRSALPDGCWYVSHAGLLRIAQRRKRSGIKVEWIGRFSDPAAARWAFEATVFKSRDCRGFVGYGDADPSNVSPLVHG